MSVKHTNRADMERRIRACELAERIKPSAPPSEGTESAIRILRSVTPDPYRLDDPLPTLRRVQIPPEIKKAEPPMPIGFAEPEPLFFAEVSKVKALAYWVWVVLVMLGVVVFSSPEIRELIF